METKERTKAREFYKTFINVGSGMISDVLAKQCARACCDKLINEVIGNAERVEFYRAVRAEIDTL